MTAGDSCCAKPSGPSPFAPGSFQNAGKTAAVAGVAAGILIAGAAWEPARHLSALLWEYLRVTAGAVLLGLLIGGTIDHFVPHWYVERLMAGSHRRTIARSVVLGFFMSACCHGILAVAVELYRKGASTASVIAFLLASPWANLPLTILLAGFFGWKALYFVFGAILTAYVTGRLFQMYEKQGWVERNPNVSSNVHTDPVGADLTARFQAYRWTPAQLKADAEGILTGALKLADTILWWILAGAIIASCVGAFVPSHWMQQYLGPGLSGLSLTLLGAAVLEVCSEGTAPLAFEIYRQTGAFGNAFVFLMAGVATDYTEIGLIWQTIGKRAAILLPLTAVPQILLLGFLANYIF